MSVWKKALPSRDEQFQLKRQILLREAGRAFSRKGFHNTSLDDVAKTLGVTKAALYHYIKGKEELLTECHLLSLDLADEALKRAVSEGEDAAAKLGRFVRHYVKTLTSEFGSCAVLTDIHALTPAARKTVQARRDAFEAKLRKLVRGGLKDGSVRAADPKLPIFFMMGAINWVLLWYSPNGPLTGEEIAIRFEEQFLNGIR
ncbi:MAG: TetR family transcriptional regulator [Anaerolineales bacterium]|nr:TetR family transcriptional regulator [Anaerolineales bacterium]